MRKPYINVCALISLVLVASIPLACSATSPTMIATAPQSTRTNSDVTDTPTFAPTQKLRPTSVSSPTQTLIQTPLTVVIPRTYTIDITPGGDLPSDLQEYIFGYPPGGGGGPVECSLNPGLPTWVQNYNGENILGIPQVLRWVVDALPTPPSPEALLALPDGSTFQLQPDYDDFNCTHFSYDVVPGSLLGTYALEVVQGDSTLSDSFTLAMPAEPIRIIIGGDEWFEGFLPNETVTLWMYYYGYVGEFLQPDMATLFPNVDIPDYSNILSPAEIGLYDLNAFLGTQTVVADESGTFQVRYTSEQLNGIINLSRISSIAQGEISGFTPIFDWKCDNLPPSRLVIGQRAQVTDHVNATEVNFITSSLSPGIIVNLVLGPMCRTVYGGASYWVWIVDYPGQTSYEAAECDAEGYFLEPIAP